MRSGIPARCLAIVLLLPLLAACQTDEGGPSTFLASDDIANQPFPNNYKVEILAFMRTYLNNPVGVRDAAMADPVLRTVSGRPRYIACLRFAERQSDGSYREARERRSGAPRVRKARRMCRQPSSQYGAAPSIELLRTLMAISPSVSTAVRER